MQRKEEEEEEERVFVFVREGGREGVPQRERG
jgi:hypothetical protein